MATSPTSTGPSTGPSRTRGPHLHQRSGTAGRDLPVRASHVRDDGRLGDRAHQRRPAAVLLDFAEIWQAADKVVYSTTLKTVSTARTRIERAFDTAKVEQLKATTARDIANDGPDLASQALSAGLVDACHLFIAPTVVGGGTWSLPTGVRFSLELRDVRRFGNGMVHLDYRTTP